MAVQRGIGTVVFSIVGIVIIIAAVVIILLVFKSAPPAKELIYKTIDLRRAADPVDKANLISALDDLVAQSKSTDVKDQWDRMMQCLSSTCPDEAFLDMSLVTVATFENDVPESALLVNVIATSKYWGNAEHLLEFSKALSMANEQIQLLDDRKVEKLWQQIVECNNVCPEKNDLYFELIKTIVQ
ncbi:Uncharacterised protein [uncultured archaeon]|nr:Uncharacterised protein [uncultured archaeon]